MSSKPNKKQSYVSVHRQKFIFSPFLKTNLLSSHQHYKTATLDSESFKRNILFVSAKNKSHSQQKIASDPLLIRKSDDVKPSKPKNVKSGTSYYQKEEQKLKLNKFKVINTELDPGVSWQKWKKGSVNLAGRNFITALNSKIQKQTINSQIEEKQNMQIFQLKHKIRELSSLKQTIRMTKKNNDLIKKLQNQSNEKIGLFFRRYQKIVQELK